MIIISEAKTMHHKCWLQGPGGKKGWRGCTACDGRDHLPGCTAKMNKNKDCCPERHKMLFDQGHIHGLIDSSLIMWAEDYPLGYHPSDIPHTDPRSSQIIISEAEIMRDCPICKGRGCFLVDGTTDPILYESCPECGGSGKISRDRGARSTLD